MNQKKIKKWLLLLIWMAIIYLFSAQPHSGDMTQGIIERIIPSLAATKQANIINYIIRKTAHITEYFILTLLIYSLLKEYKIKKKHLGILSIILAFLYACTDEFHQALVPGRSALLKDCLIDSIGSILFILLNNKLKDYHKKTYNNSK